MAAAIAFGNRWEGRLPGITDRLEQDAILGGDGLRQEGEVAIDGGRHRLRDPVPRARCCLRYP